MNVLGQEPWPAVDVNDGERSGADDPPERLARDAQHRLHVCSGEQESRTGLWVDWGVPMGHDPRESAHLEPEALGALKDTKRRRSRKRETTVWLQRVWATGLSQLEVPISQRGNRTGYKLLAAALLERREFLLWPGHRRDDARAVVKRVVTLIGRDRHHTVGAARQRLDRLHRSLSVALEHLPGPLWDVKKQRYRPDPGAHAILIGLEANSDTRAYAHAARDSLRQEYGDAQHRGRQLAKEIGEGTSLPLETKLRGLVRSMKNRGDLPTGAPMEHRPRRA